jgi:hypothetical protein
VRAESLLPAIEQVQAALGTQVRVEPVRAPGGTPSPENILQAAARDSAFRRFAGRLLHGETKGPIAISAMALVFDSAPAAFRTFDRVAAAAHMRTKLDGSEVAVETVTSPNGLVSYWGYVYRGEAMVILTVDTLDPQRVSIGSLRSLAGHVAARLDRPATAG